MTTLAALPRRVFWRTSLLADTSSPAPELLTITEVAARLRISRWLVYQLLNSGRLTSLTIGRRRLVPASAVALLIDSLTSETQR